MSPRTVSWFSCGAASAVATWLTLQDEQAAIPVYCATRSEHEDNERFMLDCQRWFNRSVTRISSFKFQDTWHVWEQERYLSGINGAPCTRALKFRPRLEWQKPDDIHVFGYTADKTDVRRAEAMRENYPEMTIRTPLIDLGITKSECLGRLQQVGIELPALYKLGFHNNNCMPCVKGQSPAYWALVRLHFPEKFERMVALSRKLKVKLCKAGNEWAKFDSSVVPGSRQYIDDIPADHSTINPILPSCDFLCSAMEPAQ